MARSLYTSISSLACRQYAGEWFIIARCWLERCRCWLDSCLFSAAHSVLNTGEVLGQDASLHYMQCKCCAIATYTGLHVMSMHDTPYLHHLLSLVSKSTAASLHKTLCNVTCESLGVFDFSCVSGHPIMCCTAVQCGFSC